MTSVHIQTIAEGMVMMTVNHQYCCSFPVRSSRRRKKSRNGGAEEKRCRVLELDIEIKLMCEVWGWRLYTSPDVDLRLVVGQFQKHHGCTGYQGANCEEEQPIIRV